MADQAPWAVVLGGEAERDFANIIEWTARTFGPHQAIVYAQHLKALVSVFRNGPQPAGYRARDEIGAGWCTLHLRMLGLNGRHFALYRAQDRTIQIVRILHDSMELARHVPPET
ncbi:MAG: type II toxin-antitoxin system RelE/ParE family toxin [Alphaproteobacteria bacterium]|nr:type II toxin-antitoxin system RelE/ParE family toxin [Alphaproteobacteria bacterium]